MIMFHVGQQVICIDDRSKLPNLPAGCRLTVKGCVYEVRGAYTCPFSRRLILTFEEIVNAIHPSGLEYGYDASHFRPVKPTSIEVFHQLLSPIHERETV